MIQRRLQVELEKVAQRYRRLRLWGLLAVNWLAAALIGLLLVTFLPGASLGLRSAAWLASAFLILGAVIAWLAVRSVGDNRWLARKIEVRHPELQARLLTAVEQQPDVQTGRFGYLQETVIREALEHGHRCGWDDTVSDGKLATVRIAHGVALVAFVVALLVLAGSGPESRNPLASTRSDADLTALGRYRVEVKPGDIEIERGGSLVVIARFVGELPPDAELIVESASGKADRLPMSRSLDDPLYGARVASVTEDLTYRVAFDQQQTQPYRVTVFEYPAMLQADAKLAFPEYTSLPEKEVADTRRVTAVEGTRLTWVCRLNKPVASAHLESDDGETLPLTASADDPTVYTVSFTMTQTRRHRLHLQDAQGRTNPEPPELVANVIPNRPAEIEIAWPARDTQVSPLEEFDLEATVWDDFGLGRYGIIFSHAGQEEQEVVLGEGGRPKERRSLAHQIDLEQLQAEPDQLLSYYFFAEDYGPDGQVRRTLSDIFFAEVRRFEEIFREGEQPAGGQQQQQQQQQAGQNAQQAEQLAELQKQIIAGAWNVLRRERPGDLSSQFAPDVRLLVESQGAALEQLEELADRVQDRQSQDYVEEAKRHMVAATQNLMRAVDDESPEPLRDALPEEQAAYQGLLKLRAREYQVTRSRSQQQSGGGGGGGGAMQRQLDQLELRNDENRYEDQRTARDRTQEAQQREVRQTLNRLRELAQRQEDLNKQLQEMQAALEQATTEEEREEIRRRLKRLREEEQQMLRDIDELRERMDQAQDQQAMAEAQQRLNESRENVRRASEALEQGRVSQALAEGSRAQREFEALRDEFRRRAAGQFDEQLREMRQAARELEENERRLAQQMQDANRPDRPRTLRDAVASEEIARGFERQQQDLQRLLNQMEEVVKEAEQPEPLLADQLYESLRNARQERIDRALETARQLAQAGLVDQAAPAEQAAQRGLENLRQGVERAAESILGDGTEALRRAHETLQDLTEQLRREAESREQASGNTPQDPTDRRPEQGALQESEQSGSQNKQPNSAQQPGQSQQPGRQQQSDQQPPSDQQENSGQQQSGQRQSGQQQSGQQPPSEDSRQPGQQQGESQSQGDSQPQGSASQQGSSPQQGAASGGGNAEDPTSPARRPRSLRNDRNQEPPSFDRSGPSGGAFDHQGGPMNPLTGENFREWSDQLRDVEEMLDDPELRGEAARVRDRARAMRAEYKRHSREPNWDLVRLELLEPLADLRDRVAEELIRRQSPDTLTPIDRDPVPPQFVDPVRRYYEELGRGK